MTATVGLTFMAGVVFAGLLKTQFHQLGFHHCWARATGTACCSQGVSVYPSSPAVAAQCQSSQASWSRG